MLFEAPVTFFTVLVLFLFFGGHSLFFFTHFTHCEFAFFLLCSRSAFFFEIINWAIFLVFACKLFFKLFIFSVVSLSYSENFILI